MDRFLGKFNLSRLNQEKIEIMNNTFQCMTKSTTIKKRKKNK